MITVRRILVSIGIAALVVMLGKTAIAHEPSGGGHHASHEGHKASHDAHHEEHHDANHERHDEDHKKPDHHAHHHDSHHDEHYAHHDNHPWWRSWHHPTDRDVCNWFGGWGWTNPVYYGYGANRTVLYPNNTTYVTTTGNAAPDQPTNTVQTLADVTPSSESLSNESDWLPLGTFALTQQGDNNQSSQMLQLSVNKSGVVSGVLFNSTNGTSSQVHGSVDQKTQRVAFRLGDSGLVAETGIQNLTRDKADLLVHQGNGKPQRYTLVRFQAPQGGEQSRENVN
jgi:hypothetical protein